MIKKISRKRKKRLSTTKKKVENKKERIDEEPKGEKEKEPEEVIEKETTSTEILLVSFLPTNKDIPLTLVTQMAEYVKVRLAKFNKKPSPSIPSLNNKNDDGFNCRVQDL